jgi:hypothetical protein
MSVDSSVSKINSYGLDDRGSIPSMGRKLSVLHQVQTWSGTNSVLMALFQGVKQPEVEAKPSCSYNAKVKNELSLPPRLHASLWRDAWAHGKINLTFCILATPASSLWEPVTWKQWKLCKILSRNSVRLHASEKKWTEVDKRGLYSELNTCR